MMTVDDPHDQNARCSMSLPTFSVTVKYRLGLKTQGAYGLQRLEAPHGEEREVEDALPSIGDKTLDITRRMAKEGENSEY